MLKVPLRMKASDSSLPAPVIRHWIIDEESEVLGQAMAVRRVAPVETLAVCTLDSWLVKAGEQVRPGQPIAVVSTNGVSEIIVSPHHGIVITILVREEETVRTGDCLCMIADSGDVFSNRGGPRLKFQTSAQRHMMAAYIVSQGYKL